MKYYLDTEFLEGEQSRRVFGIKIGNTKPTIDLISVGLVSEDNREYYAISKDFNLYEAWNRYDIVTGDCRSIGDTQTEVKVYWIRENVLKPIFEENTIGRTDFPFTYKNMKTVIDIVGKSNAEIANEIIDFTFVNSSEIIQNGIEFYTYFGDYDWVVFCWIFGKMIDLPKGFPKYSIDLKQILDEKALTTLIFQLEGKSIKDGITELKNNPNYPAPYNEHNALSDAKWNQQLHKFLIK